MEGSSSLEGIHFLEPLWLRLAFTIGSMQLGFSAHYICIGLYPCHPVIQYSLIVSLKTIINIALSDFDLVRRLLSMNSASKTYSCY